MECKSFKILFYLKDYVNGFFLCTNILHNEDILQVEKLVSIKIHSTSLSVVDDFIPGETLPKEIYYNTLVMDDFITDPCQKKML